MLIGHCQCNKVRFEVHLPRSLSEYIPRSCDCNFCNQRQIRYLSDPDGHLIISETALENIIKQGDELARFIQCNRCGDVIAAYYGENKKHYRCAINAQLLVDKKQLQSSQVVSPRLLSAEEKVKRWSELWMPIKLSSHTRVNK